MLSLEQANLSLSSVCHGQVHPGFFAAEHIADLESPSTLSPIENQGEGYEAQNQI